ncbi:pilus assembly PilX N-terminal domain-containing protein [Jeongeupia sp. USM3]|uniref:pilus assembly PilX family protein n=1 Tax=Jeongeupia sp. USM3 TaxID=1906741 RepID=UPI00089DDC4E|nr:pilus assembly PilX N-terminal domain-containing protein [Jeongeupia sp. USM3]AOX99659.1 hypothetical protein BJP62_03830 [Jeongeupia sp. USM3]
MADYRMHRQAGLATLAVTLILVFIATTAALYANKNAFVFQKSSANHYQHLKAFEAAEAGANELAARLQADVALLTDNVPGNDGNTVLLQKAASSGGARCANGAIDSAYIFKSSYSNYVAGVSPASDRYRFAAGRYFSNALPLLTASAGVNPGLAYRAQAFLDGGTVSIVSEGCADDATATPSITAPACANDGPKAQVRTQIKLPAMINTGNNALINKGYMDIFGAVHVAPDAGAPTPNCDVVTGGTLTHTGSAGYQQTSVPEIAGLSSDNFFKMIFGADKAAVKANASVVTPTTGCPAIAAGTSVLWIEGNWTLTSGCTLSTGNPLVVIVNGNLTQNGGELQVTGFLYAQNVNRNTQITVNGAAAFDGNMDGLIPNGPADGNATHAAYGSTAIYYNPDKFKVAPLTQGSGVAGSWVDF